MVSFFQAIPRRAAIVLALAAIVLVAAAPAAADEETDRALLGCSNGKKDGLESGIDCGGPASHCPTCGPGKGCKIDKDCQSNQCLGGVCAFGPTCNNGIKDIDETDIDCGGIASGCLPCCWNKVCQMDRDCQSGLCADGRCGEAKFCASRFLYDALGVNIQLRTYDGFEATLHHTPDPIKCGQCVCEDCPVTTYYFTATVADTCNSTTTTTFIATLRAAIVARSSTTTPIEIYCVDAPTAGRRLLASSTIYGSACPNDPNFVLPQTVVADATKANVAGSCVLSYAPSPPPSPSPPPPSPPSK